MRILYVDEAIKDLNNYVEHISKGNCDDSVKLLVENLTSGIINWLLVKCVNIDVETGEILDE